MQLMERDAKTVPRGVTGVRQLQGRRCSFIKKIRSQFQELFLCC